MGCFDFDLIFTQSIDGYEAKYLPEVGQLRLANTTYHEAVQGQKVQRLTLPIIDTLKKRGYKDQLKRGK